MDILPDLVQEYFLVSTYHKFQTVIPRIINSLIGKGIIFIKRVLEQIKGVVDCDFTFLTLVSV